MVFQRTAAGATRSEPITILMVDDHAGMRRGLINLLEGEPGVTVVGEADGPAAAVATAAAAQPDVAIVDLVYATGSGFDLIRDLRARGCRVVVNTAADGPGYPEQCLRAGATGFVSKGEPLACLVRAVRLAATGATYLNESRAGEVVARLIRGPAGGTDATAEATGSPVDRLSPGEFRVFDLIGQGLSNKDVAVALHRSIKTIETYRSRIKRKLGAANATQLAQLAAARTGGLVAPAADPAAAGAYAGGERQRAQPAAAVRSRFDAAAGRTRATLAASPSTVAAARVDLAHMAA